MMHINPQLCRHFRMPTADRDMQINHGKLKGKVPINAHHSAAPST